MGENKKYDHAGYNRKYYAKSESWEQRNGDPWNDLEISMIMERKLTDTELSCVLRRSIQAIQLKRCRLKKAKRKGVN